MVHRIARRMLGRLWWALRYQVNRITWSFFVWERHSQLPQLTQGRIILAGSGDEAIGERLAVLRGASVDKYRAWLKHGFQKSAGRQRTSFWLRQRLREAPNAPSFPVH